MTNLKDLVTFTRYNEEEAKKVREAQEQSLRFDDVEIVKEWDNVNHCWKYIVACEPLRIGS